jgi:hypothetical protein
MNSDTCGPLHEACACEWECFACGGRVEMQAHDCSCDLCDVERAWHCQACGAAYRRFDVEKAGTYQRRQENRKLAEWSAWAREAAT